MCRRNQERYTGSKMEILININSSLKIDNVKQAGECAFFWLAGKDKEAVGIGTHLALLKQRKNR